MGIEAEKIIPHAAEDIVAAYTDRQFHEHLAAKVGATLLGFDVSGSVPTEVKIYSKQSMPADKLPEIAQKVLKGTVTVSITDTWSAPDADGSRRSDTVVEVSGAPIKALASQTLHARGEAETKATVRGDVEVKIPLIGKKVKSAAEPYIRKFVELQAKEVTAWLNKPA